MLFILGALFSALFGFTITLLISPESYRNQRGNEILLWVSLVCNTSLMSLFGLIASSKFWFRRLFAFSWMIGSTLGFAILAVLCAVELNQFSIDEKSPKDIVGLALLLCYFLTGVLFDNISSTIVLFLFTVFIIIFSFLTDNFLLDFVKEIF